VQAMTGYVEGLIEKAQTRAAMQAAPVEKPSLPPAPIAEQASVLLEAEDDEDRSDELPIYWPIYFFFDENWRSRAEGHMVRIRRAIMEHRRRQEKLRDDSARRITASRALLKESVPLRPRWLDTAR